MNEHHGPDMTLSELCQTYIETNPRLRSEHSRKLMVWAVDRFQEFLSRSGTLADLNEKALVDYANYRKTLGRSERTIERELSKLSCLWRYAGTQNWCAPVHFSVQKCAPPTPTAWSPAEMNAIFKAAAEYESKIRSLPASLILVALLRLAYDTGERVTALLLVEWTDIDLDGRWVTFRSETRKGGVRARDNVQRFSRQTRRALNLLRAMYQHNHVGLNLVFLDCEKSNYYGHLRMVLKKLGLPMGRNCMFHKLRRTHATHLYLVGGDATQSLCHESDAMTRGYYLDPRYTRAGSYLSDLAGGPWGLLARLWRRLKAACGIF